MFGAIFRPIRDPVVRRTSRLTLGLATPLTLSSVLIRDFGGSPHTLWDVLGVVGVVLFVLSFPPQCYDLYSRWLLQRKGGHSADN